MTCHCPSLVSDGNRRTRGTHRWCTNARRQHDTSRADSRPGMRHDSNGTPGGSAIRHRSIYQEFRHITARHADHEPSSGTGTEGRPYARGMAVATAHDVAAAIRRRLPGVGTLKLHKLLY